VIAEVIELRAAPGGAEPAEHVHPGRWEVLTVVSGALGARVAGRKTKLGPGQVLGVAPGVAHAWWNAGDDELVVRYEISPARRLAA
jgi:quercetin dioxygenase-like cupin family protein